MLDVIANDVVLEIVTVSDVETTDPVIDVVLILTVNVSSFSTNKSSDAVISKDPVSLLMINEPLVGDISVVIDVV